MRKLKNRFKRPRMVWDSVLIESDKTILKDYGLRRKREIWAAQETLRRFRQRARELNATQDKVKERILLDKLIKLGLVQANSHLDDVLSLTLNNMLDRRLQTIVFKKGLASTMREARQFITHGHVTIGGKKVTVPSYLVTADEEKEVKFFVGFTPKRLEPKKGTKPAKPKAKEEAEAPEGEEAGAEAAEQEEGETAPSVEKEVERPAEEVKMAEETKARPEKTELKLEGEPNG